MDQSILAGRGTVPTASFSTASIEPRHRFEAWRRFIGITHDIEAEAQDFHGETTSIAVDRMSVHRMNAAAQAVARSPQRCRRDGLDHVTLHFTTAAFQVETETQSFLVAPGAITVNTLARPFRRSSASESGSLIVSLSRELVSEHIADPEAFHGARLQSGFAGLLRAHMEGLNLNGAALRMGEAAGVARATAALLAAGLTPNLRTLGEARPAAQAAALTRCKAFIDGRLRSPDLTPDAICRGAGVSRPVLYRLFKAQGGVASYIRERRLRAVRDALTRAPERASIADLAYSYGFSNVPAFNRAFRQAFGMAPSDVESAAPPADVRQAPGWRTL